MAKLDLIMPKMGESIMEATILKWVKNPGDKVEEDDTVLEIATDKVDSEIPSPVDGILSEVLFKENDVVPVGTVIARIETDAAVASNTETPAAPVELEKETPVEAEPSTNGHDEVEAEPIREEVQAAKVPMPQAVQEAVLSKSELKKSARFYSPLVRNIAAQEKINIEELEMIPGSGKEGRVTKKDILNYLETRHAPATSPSTHSPTPVAQPTAPTPLSTSKENVEIIEMDRMRKLIADHMVMSKHTSPHVTSFVEADVTNLVNWRNEVKNEFQAKHGERITFTPIFIDAVVKAIRDFPMVNISLEGDNILKKNYVNIGMATALPSGNLIVPVIKNADLLNLVGLAKSVNDLANRARTNKLKPEDIQDGTFTITNVGTFGNVMGTPIINQPQVAILATGAIRKKPAVVETEYGDVIAVRQMMFLSLSYDHRIVDGFLGGSFLRRIADYLESFNQNQSF